MSKLKFLGDPLFPEGSIATLRGASFDAVHALEIGAGDLPGLEILRLATFESRVVLTMNQTLLRIAEGERAAPSLVLFRQRRPDPENMAQLLLSLLPLFTDDLAAGAMVIIRDDQTLLRKFPRAAT